MFESIIMIATYLTAIFTPVLIPATIHAVHAFRDWRPTYQPRLTARFPRLVVSRRRLAVPATG